MTDARYYECYESLYKLITTENVFDDDLFCEIFDGKIKPIIRNSFSGCSGDFSFIDFDDICQEIFMLLWKKSVSCYFLNPEFEKNAAWYLSWCKTVTNRYIITQLRKKNLKPVDSLDDPDHPVEKAYEGDFSSGIMSRESVKTVYGLVLKLSTKVEMKLVWLGIFNMIYSGEAESKIEANHMFLERYSGRELYELRNDVGRYLESTEWLGIEDSSFVLIDDALEQKSGGKAFGHTKVSEILGDSPLSRLSDWTYKINKKIIESLPSEELL